MSSPKNELLGINKEYLINTLKDYGFINEDIALNNFTASNFISKEMISKIKKIKEEVYKKYF